MPQLTYNTTAREDKGIRARCDLENAQLGTTLTPLQFLNKWIKNSFESWAKEAIKADGETKQELYQKATAADQAAIDAILAKYL